MIRAAVVLDTNVYRSLTDVRFGTLLGLEARREVGRFADPWVLMELLAHLAHPKDPHFDSCRRATRRFWVRCVGGPAEQPHGILRDSESQLVRTITGQGLPRNEASLDGLLALGEAVARTPDDQSLSRIEEGLRAVADHVAREEALLAEKFHRLRERVKALLGSLSEGGERGPVRAAAMRELESDVFRRAIAETLIKGAHEDVGRAVPDPIPENLLQRVLTVGAVGITFYLQLLRKGIYDGADLEASRTRNLLWDQRISYNIGGFVEGRPIWLVTDDPAFRVAAAVAGHEERVLGLAAYEQWLAQEGPVA